jgi:hypothetical protein
MKNPYQRRAASKPNTGSYDPQTLYKQFLETMVSSGGIYALYNDGWALCATPTGQRAFAIWRNNSLAKLLVKDNWQNYDIQFVGLRDFIEKVIPFLKQESTTISLDLTPEGQNILISPERFIIDIKNALYQIYINRPEYFKQHDVPLPRHIRLN